jgi:hypothetical protein
MKNSKINLKIKRPITPKGGLRSLEQVELFSKPQKMLDKAVLNCFGSAPWRYRKQAEARDLFALGQISGRMEVKEIDIREALRAILLLEVPVPQIPGQNGQLQIANQVIIGLKYREEAIGQPQPGYSFVQILAPRNIWHANVGPVEHGQPLCLASSLPASIPVKEIVLMVYGALSMQTVMIDERDSAGVMNPDAARWWQLNLDKMPLTQEPFIRIIQ